MLKKLCAISLFTLTMTSFSWAQEDCKECCQTECQKESEKQCDKRAETEQVAVESTEQNCQETEQNG